MEAPSSPGRTASLPFLQRWRAAVLAAAVGGPLVTCWILSAIRGDVPAATAVLVLVLWVVAAAATGDRVAGLLASLSAGAWFDFFLTQPYRKLTIDDPDDLQAAVLLVLIGAAVTEIALWGRRQQAHAARHSGYLEGVLGVAGSAFEADTPPQVVIDLVARQIRDVLDADGCHYVPGPVHDTRVALLDREGTLTRHGTAIDVDRVGLPSDEYVAIVVRRADRVLGHFLVTAASRASYPSLEDRRVAVLLADQTAVLEKR